MIVFARKGNKHLLNILAVLSLMMALCVSIFGVSTENAYAADSFTRQIPSSGSATLRNTGPEGVDGIQFPEFSTAFGPEAANSAAPSSRAAATNKAVINRSKSHDNQEGNNQDDNSNNRGLAIPVVKGTKVVGTTPNLKNTYTGLNFRQQRLANGGNQFSIEPPDQGLCVGNGFVLESVNDVLRVFDTSGTTLTIPVDLNTFYGYPATIIRSTLTYGPELTDPSCYFDKDTQRFFHVVLTLDRIGTTSALSGINHLDIAVSNTSSPLGSWTIYKIPVQDDGTSGSPNHGCTNPDVTSGFGPCIGDYPHIGADANGIYLTTNEYSFFGPEFIGAQIYAISKKQLTSGSPTVTVVQFDTSVKAGSHTLGGNPGFTVWPATAPNGNNSRSDGGTEYFLSSTAADEVYNGGLTPGPRKSNNIGLWAITNSSSLNGPNPNLKLINRMLESESYAVPPPSNQKPGNFPQGQCINDTTSPTPFGPGCWQYLFVTEPAHNEVESLLDSNDSRMQQVTYANGMVYGALDTAVKVNGQTKAGIAYFMVSPRIIGNGQHIGPQSEIQNQGYLAVTGNNVNYPSIGVLNNGQGIMSFTLTGDNYYPSASYTTLSEDGTGQVYIAGAGKGPEDGFTGYKAQVGDPPRPRWGDYGATAVDGNNIYFANEFIDQTCTLQQYMAAPFGSCGGTRTALGNWATRISQVTLRGDDNQSGND